MKIVIILALLSVTACGNGAEVGGDYTKGEAKGPLCVTGPAFCGTPTDTLTYDMEGNAHDCNVNPDNYCKMLNGTHE